MRREGLAFAATALVPGLGHLLLRRRRVGALLVFLALAPLGLAAYLAWSDLRLALEIVVRVELVIVVLVVLGVSALLRPAAVVLLWRSARGAWRPSAPLVAVTGLCALALSAPYAVVGYYLYDTHAVLAHVFTGRSGGDDGWPIGKPGRDDRVGAGTTGSRTLQAVPAAPPKRTRVNLLLIGGDAGWDRWGLRADTLIVVSLQATTGRTAVFGIPRNLHPVPLYGEAGRQRGQFKDLINALYEYGQRNPKLFPGGPDPGAEALKQTVSGMLAIPIDYYALVDLRAFVELVDAFGGVDVVALDSVSDRVSPPYKGEPWIPIDVTRGKTYHLNGRRALAYARSRHQSDDYTRMRRQRCLLQAMASQLTVAEVLRNYPHILGSLRKYARTDLPLDRLPDLVDLVMQIDEKHSVAVTLGPPHYSHNERPDIAAVREIVHEALADTRPRPDMRLRALTSDCKA